MRSLPRVLFSALMLCAGLAATAAAQEGHPHPTPVPATHTEITVEGVGITSSRLTAANLQGMPRLTVTAEDHGQSASFEGVSLAAILERAGAPRGHDLRGEKLALVLVVGAADGYRAVFALPELDPGFTDKVVILADRRDGKPLDAQEGPWRIVAVGEKRQARWVRQVTSLSIREVKP